GAGRKAHDSAVYRTQLSEIDEELARGALDPGEAGAARLEIQRRLLRADQGSDGAAAGRAGLGIQIATAIVLMLVPLTAGSLYLLLGRPDAADIDRAALQAQAEQADRQRAEAEQMIAQLQQRLDAEPERAEGWFLLGRSLLMTDRPA